MRGDGKFERIVAFGSKLPGPSGLLRRELKLRGYPREKVLTIVVSVMAETWMRVGNPEYARDHKALGLTTLVLRFSTFSLHLKRLHTRLATQNGETPWRPAMSAATTMTRPSP